MHLQLSIIIPVYKVEKYLPQCLDSIVAGINGKGSDVEVLVIDDGSPDRSGEIADNYACRYPYIRVIHKQNEGVAAARNTGMAAAKGEWLYFVDSDDWIGEGAIETLFQRCSTCRDVDIIMMDAWKNTGDEESAWEHFKEEAIWQDQEALRGLQKGMLYFPAAGIKTGVPLAAPWDKLYRRKFLLENKIFFHPELKVLDDMVFNVEAFGKAEKAAYYKDRIYHYRYVSDSITNNYSPDRVAQDRKVWEYLEDYMAEYVSRGSGSEKELAEFRQAYYCRMIKSFSICCRLSFFHPANRKTFRDKIKYVKSVWRTEPYATAFKNVRLRNAEWKLKAVVIVQRFELGIGMYLLYKLQSFL